MKNKKSLLLLMGISSLLMIFVVSGLFSSVREQISARVIDEGPSTVFVDASWDGPENAGGHLWLVDAFNSIQPAVDAVATAGTVTIAVGNYPSESTIRLSKSLTLVGPGIGNDNVANVTNTDCNYVFDVRATDVTIRGLLIQQSDGEYCHSYPAIRITSARATVDGNEIAGGYRGVQMRDDSSSASITNNKLHDNRDGISVSGSANNTITGNEIYNNTSDGIDFRDGSCDDNCVNDVNGNIVRENNIHDNPNGIYVRRGLNASQTPVIITSNTIHNNSCDGITINGDVVGFTITNNTISNNGGECAETGFHTYSEDHIIFHDNILSGNNAGIDYSGEYDTPFDATRNFWGAANGPSGEFENSGEGDSVNGNVTFNPFYVDQARTTLNNYTGVPIKDLVPITLNLAQDVENPDIDVSSLLTGLSGIIPKVSINSTTSVGNVNVEIPSGTTATGDEGWNGVLHPPTVKPNDSVVLANGTVSSAIEIGFDNIAVTFDKGVRILLSGQGGKLVGYSRNDVFTEITDVCADDTQVTGDALPAGGNCKITVGGDMVVWTKHFTTFVTFSSGTGGGRRRLEVCGDGILQNPNSDNQNETCDDGNTVSGDGCSDVCQLEIVVSSGGTAGGGSHGAAASETLPTVTTTVPVVVPKDTHQTIFLKDIIGDPEYDAINHLVNRGIVHGYPDATYRPKEPLNRAETSTLIGLLIGISPDTQQSGDYWFSALQRALVNAGILMGNVSPKSLEHRANFLMLVAKAKKVDLKNLPACTTKTFADVGITSTYCPILQYALSAGWILESSGKFGPSLVVTRSWAAGILDRAFKKES